MLNRPCPDRPTLPRRHLLLAGAALLAPRAAAAEENVYAAQESWLGRYHFIQPRPPGPGLAFDMTIERGMIGAPPQARVEITGRDLRISIQAEVAGTFRTAAIRCRQMRVQRGPMISLRMGDIMFRLVRAPDQPHGMVTQWGSLQVDEIAGIARNSNGTYWAPAG